MKINPLCAAIGFVLIEHDLNARAPVRGATNTGPAARPSVNGAHLAPGLPRGGGGFGPDIPCPGNGEGFADAL